MNAKPWWQSKTVWFQIVVAVVAMLDVTRDLVLRVVGEGHGAHVVLAIAAVNIVLRVITTQGVSAK